MWLCVLEIINAMLGTLFIILIVEVKGTPWLAWIGEVGWGKYSYNPIVPQR